MWDLKSVSKRQTGPVQVNYTHPNCQGAGAANRHGLPQCFEEELVKLEILLACYHRPKGSGLGIDP